MPPKIDSLLCVCVCCQLGQKKKKKRIVMMRWPYYSSSFFFFWGFSPWTVLLFLSHFPAIFFEMILGPRTASHDAKQMRETHPQAKGRE